MADDEGRLLTDRTDSTLDSENAAQEGFWNHVSANIKFEFEEDLYTNAFVACFEHPSYTGVNYYIPKLVPISLMLMVALVQIMATVGVYAYVRHTMRDERMSKLLTAADMFLGANSSMPIWLSESLCGSFETVELASGRYSSLAMSDGTLYQPTNEPSYYYMRMPSRTWQYKPFADMNSVLGDTLMIIHNGVFESPFTVSAYGSTLIVLTMMWLFTINVEIRRILHFLGMVISYYRRKNESFEGNAADLVYNPEEESFELVKISTLPFMIAVLIVTLRLAIAISLLITGCQMLFFTLSKFDLVLNSVALHFVLELDNMVYWSLSSSIKQAFIKAIYPPTYSRISCITPAVRRSFKTWQGLFTAILVIAISFLIRLWQCQVFTSYFYSVSSLCLFAGPVPAGQSNMVAAAPGFCESLLSAACMPRVSGPGSVHGPCVVTDQRVGQDASIHQYISASLFSATPSSSWTSWDEAPQIFYKSRIWVRDYHQDLLRKQCIQMYQSSGSLDHRLVSSSTTEVMRGAPFLCDRSIIMKAVFEPAGFNIFKVRRPEEHAWAVDACQTRKSHILIDSSQNRAEFQQKMHSNDAPLNKSGFEQALLQVSKSRSKLQKTTKGKSSLLARTSSQQLSPSGLTNDGKPHNPAKGKKSSVQKVKQRPDDAKEHVVPTMILAQIDRRRLH